MKKFVFASIAFAVPPPKYLRFMFSFLSIISIALLETSKNPTPVGYPNILYAEATIKSGLNSFSISFNITGRIAADLDASNNVKHSDPSRQISSIFLFTHASRTPCPWKFDSSAYANKCFLPRGLLLPLNHFFFVFIFAPQSFTFTDVHSSSSFSTNTNTSPPLLQTKFLNPTTLV